MRDVASSSHDFRSPLGALRELIAKTGPLWSGTKLSGYAEDGPYHCGDCKWLNGTMCDHPIVKADPQTKKNADGMPVVNAAKGCCEFVEPED